MVNMVGWMVIRKKYQRCQTKEADHHACIKGYYSCMTDDAAGVDKREQPP
jgi:hypothetical protein